MFETMFEIRSDERYGSVFEADWAGDVIVAAERLGLSPETVMVKAIGLIEGTRDSYERSAERFRIPVVHIPSPKNGATYGMAGGEVVMVQGVSFFLNEGEIGDIRTRLEELTEVSEEEMRFSRPMLPGTRTVARNVPRRDQTGLARRGERKGEMVMGTICSG